MAKLVKGVESTDVGFKEMINVIFTTSQLVDLHYTFIKTLEHQMNYLLMVFNKRKSVTLPSKIVQNLRNNGTYLEITKRSGRVIPDPCPIVKSYVDGFALDDNILEKDDE